jgi:hypothetical protein
MKLYHYTSRYHLPLIEASGILSMSDAMLGTVDGAVWCFADPAVAFEADHGLGNSSLDKRAVRITIEVADAVPWLAVVGDRRIDPDWLAAVVETGGGLDAALEWWVVLRDVPASEWVAIDATDAIDAWEN